MTDSEARTRVVYLDHVAKLSGGELALARLLEAGRGRIDAHVILAEPGPIAGHLRAAGASVEVLELSDRTRELRKDRITVGLPIVAILDTLLYTRRLSRRLRELAPDLVHANALKAGVYGSLAARLAGIPMIWHLRDRLAEGYLPGPASALIRLLIRRLARVVICNSEATRASLGHQPHAVVVPSIVSAATDAEAHRRSSRDGCAPLRVGLVGRIAPWKGQDLFLRAFAAAFGDGDARAVIVGAPLFGAEEDAFAASLTTLAQELGVADRVDFRGYREDVMAELATLDVLVHASTVPEPFGQVTVEGMAAGLPVVAARAGGPAEIITDGVDGLLYPLGDQAALAAALRRLADDPELRAALGTAAATTAQRYSPEVIISRVLEVYDSVLAPRGRLPSDS